MSGFLKKWGAPVAVFILTAAISYWIVLGAMPEFVMNKAWDRLAERGSVNSAEHAGRIDADDRTIVRPSPDLAYSICPFDVSDGPLEIRVTPILEHYWSVTIFDAQTNAAFVMNDKDAGETPVSIKVTKADAANPPEAQGELNKSVQIPTAKGVALLRVLVKDEQDFQDIYETRKLFGCYPLVGSAAT